MDDSKDTKVGRREFVGLAAAATAGFTILKPGTVFGTQTNSAVRLGLLGCGGRGTAVTESFLRNTGAILTAIGDVFQDNLSQSAERLGRISAQLGRIVHWSNAWFRLRARRSIRRGWLAICNQEHARWHRVDAFLG